MRRSNLVERSNRTFIIHIDSFNINDPRKFPKFEVTRIEGDTVRIKHGKRTLKVQRGKKVDLAKRFTIIVI